MEKRLQDFCQKCMAELKAIRESIKTLRGQGNQKQHSDNNQNNPDKKAKDVKIEGAIINTSVQAEIPVTKKHDSHADDPNNTKRENLRFIIEIVSAVLLFGYVVINCLLYIDTHIISN